MRNGIELPDLGRGGSLINSYDWYYTIKDGSTTQITNTNKTQVTGTKANDYLGGRGVNFNSSTLVIASGCDALGTSGDTVVFSCDIDYSPVGTDTKLNEELLWPRL